MSEIIFKVLVSVMAGYFGAVIFYTLRLCKEIRDTKTAIREAIETGSSKVYAGKKCVGELVFIEHIEVTSEEGSEEE